MWNCQYSIHAFIVHYIVCHIVIDHFDMSNVFSFAIEIYLFVECGQYIAVVSIFNVFCDGMKMIYCTRFEVEIITFLHNKP